MKKLVLMLTMFVTIILSTNVFAGNCQHDWDQASDGSRCGGRSSDSRPGGD